MKMMNFNEVEHKVIFSTKKEKTTTARFSQPMRGRRGMYSKIRNKIDRRKNNTINDKMIEQRKRRKRKNSNNNQ